MSVRRYVMPVFMAAAISGCGGGGSSAGGGEDTDAVLRHFHIREIQFHINDQSYQPSQAEIDCVAALPTSDDVDVDVRRQQVIDCINNN